MIFHLRQWIVLAVGLVAATLTLVVLEARISVATFFSHAISSHRSDSDLAGACTPNVQSDDIQFVSCGGIY